MVHLLDLMGNPCFIWIIQVFHKHTKLAMMPIFALDALLCENKKCSNKLLPPVSIEPRPLINLQFQHSPIWTNLAFACRTDNLGILYSYPLLILTKSSKSKNQVVHEQKFKVAHARLVQKEGCWTWNQRSRGSIHTKDNILLLKIFVFM